MIEDVESLCPELHVNLFADRNPLEQRCIQVHVSWARKRAARHITEGPGRWRYEGIGIEIAARFLEAVHSQNHFPREVGIPEGHVGIAGVSSSRLVDANQRRHGEAALCVEDCIPLPAADQLVR